MKYKTQIGIVNFYPQYNEHNALFSPKAYPHGENFEYTPVLLKSELNKLGMDLNTLDVYPLSDYKDILFIDMPSQKSLPAGISLEHLRRMGKRLFLVLCESTLSKKDNYDTENHKYFDKIFTWHDPIVDGKKYIKLFLPNKVPRSVKFDPRLKTKFCAMIAGKHSSSYPLELYSERIRAIRWFEKHHPTAFDLYGIGWDSEIFRRPSINVFIKLLCRLGYFREKLDSAYFKSYKGEIKSKNAVYSQYKFSICYENVRDIEGYITEKIFDCFFAGTIPIYWGAPNIGEFIPRGTFIDKRDFDTYEKLFDYLTNMRHHEYDGFINNITDFINGDKIYPFSAENYVKTIIRECFGRSIK